MGEAIILVPGLFGFAKIGDIEYFSAARGLLIRATGIQDVTPLATPPTGPLWRRVDALHRAVLDKRAHGATRVHLVGHSTGGVDVRLLTNSKYVWPGGPTGADRTSFFDSIGAVVPISAPQKGTPIARRLRGTLESFIPTFFLVSFLAKYESGEAGRAEAVEERLELILRALARSLALRSGDLTSIDPLGGLPEGTAAALGAFLQEIVEDHPLIHELTPFAMNALNEKIAPESGARALDLAPFVTVAPPPAVHLSDVRFHGGLSPVQRLFYAASYEETRLRPLEFGPLPEGPWIGKPSDDVLQSATTAQDGVVPAASQTMDGRAEGLVYGDHLDVVGHYPGAELGGATVFDSGADFDDARMTQLWNAVANVIRRGLGAP
ncbi:MAG TPA: hypothetical protein VKU41_28510 [Polyangiaceae bacterium]|nr:hypothetical protein [Polyangiaceae bacterium]